MHRPSDWRAVRAVYDQAAGDYDRRHGDARSVRRSRAIEAPQLAIAGDGRVLELGCGTGRLLSRAGAGVRIGIDISLPMLSRARLRQLEAVCADAHSLPFASATFDAIIAGKGTFRYLDYRRAFAECARVLVPGGRLAVHQYGARTFSLRRWLSAVRGRSEEAAGDGDLHLRSPAELCEPARRSGLAVQQIYLWRSVRFWPFALRVPGWLPGDLWSHCTIIFYKSASVNASRAGSN